MYVIVHISFIFLRHHNSSGNFSNIIVWLLWCKGDNSILFKCFNVSFLKEYIKKDIRAYSISTWGISDTCPSSALLWFCFHVSFFVHAIGQHWDKENKPL